MERRWFKQVKDALEMHGITVTGYKDGRKHVRVMIEGGGVSCFIVTSASPSDVSTLKNLVTSAKRTLAERAVQRR